MREILFRAWAKNLGMSWHFALGGFPTWGHKSKTLQEWAIRCKIMQYIGIEDSEKIKIFDGDIVEASIYCHEKPSILEVYERDGCFVIDYEDSESDFMPVGWFAGSVKKIGNKLDNPELLRKI